MVIAVAVAAEVIQAVSVVYGVGGALDDGRMVNTHLGSTFRASQAIHADLIMAWLLHRGEG